MTTGSIHQAQAYWDTAAETYQEVFSGTVIGKTRRDAVWRDLQRIFHTGDRILEINCGTGLDAVFLAGKGVTLVACDISPRMIESAQRYAQTKNVSQKIEFLTLPTESLNQLPSEPRFTGAFSNFSGLNCVSDLREVQTQLAQRLTPGAPLLLCMMGRVVPWEILWFLLHGHPQLAFRRLQKSRPNPGSAPELIIHRPTVNEITAHFAPAFTLRRWKGIGVTIPPSYMEHLAHRAPRLIHLLARIDRLLGRLPLFRSLADCVVLEFERTGDL